MWPYGSTPTLNLSPNVGTEKTVAPFWYHGAEYSIVHSSPLACLSMVHVWSGKVALTPPVGRARDRPARARSLSTKQLCLHLENELNLGSQSLRHRYPTHHV